MVNKECFLPYPIFPYIVNKRFFDFIIFSILIVNKGFLSFWERIFL